MTSILVPLGFAAFWTAFMVWWSGDTSIPNVAILTACGLAIGVLWTWFMKRFGFIKA